jgi:DNA processing protein
MLGVGSAGPLGLERDTGHGEPDPLADTERRAAMLLMSVEGLGPATFYRLLAAHRSAAATLDLASSEGGRRRLMRSLGPDREPVAGQEGRPGRVVAGLAASARDAERIVARLERLGLTWLTTDDRAYPARLRMLEVPPPVLFVRGSTEALGASSSVAVVGTRHPSDLGRRVAARIADALARLGVTIVSGLAAGIDGAAHEATVVAGGSTVAVLGSGHEQLFPRAHSRLAQRIVEMGGALVSELPPDAIPTRGTFPRRNRVISGLSDATVVVEAAARSGALITAAWALEQGRECFAVPGPIDAQTSAGCLAFLREYPGQVRIVAGIAELIEDLGLAGRSPGEQPDLPGHPTSTARPPAPEAIMATLGPAERAVAGALLTGSATVDDLAGSAGLSVATVLSTLTVLELRGLVTAAGGRYRLAGGLLGVAPPKEHPVASFRRPVLP